MRFLFVIASLGRRVGNKKPALVGRGCQGLLGLLSLQTPCKFGSRWDVFSRVHCANNLDGFEIRAIAERESLTAWFMNDLKGCGFAFDFHIAGFTEQNPLASESGLPLGAKLCLQPATL